MMRSFLRTMCAGLVMLGAVLALGMPAHAQGPTGLCSFTWNATTGGWNCEAVGNGTNTVPLPVGQLPLGTPILGVGTGTTGAVVGTLAGASGKTTYICGFDISALGGTATVGPIVIAGLSGGSMTYQFSSAAAGATLSRTFTPCIPASAPNTAITITTTADGSASAVDVNSWGFQL